MTVTKNEEEKKIDYVIYNQTFVFVFVCLKIKMKQGSLHHYDIVHIELR